MLSAIWMHVTAWLVAVGGSIYTSAPHKLHIERRHFVYCFLLAVACFTYAAALTAIYELNGTAEFWKFIGLFLGPTLVAVGWVVTNEVNIRNSRKQHTINLVMQYFTNAKRIEDKDALNQALPFPSVLDPTKYDFDDTSNDLLRSAARELNYFDYLASAVLHREIDEQLLRRVFGIIIRHYCMQLRPYIEHWRRKDNTYWEDLIALDRRWCSELPTPGLPLITTPREPRPQPN
jgi:hypothetical protein